MDHAVYYIYSASITEIAEYTYIIVLKCPPSETLLEYDGLLQLKKW